MTKTSRKAATLQLKGLKRVALIELAFQRECLYEFHYITLIFTLPTNETLLSPLHFFLSVSLCYYKP